MILQDLVLSNMLGLPIVGGFISVAGGGAFVPDHDRVLVDFGKNYTSGIASGLSVGALTDVVRADDGFYTAQRTHLTLYIAAIDMVLIDKLLGVWPRDDMTLLLKGERIATLIYATGQVDINSPYKSRQAVDQLEISLALIKAGLFCNGKI